MSIYSKALEYAGLGLSVHLLQPHGEEPLNAGWMTAPNVSIEELEEGMFAEPEANFGVRLGEPTKLGQRYLYAFELDVASEDPRRVKEAHDFMRSVFRDYDQLPSSRVTGSHSRQFYFLSRVLLKTKSLGHSEGKAKVIVKGEEKLKNEWEITLCSTGRQLALPPSNVSSKPAVWERELASFIKDEGKTAFMIIDDVARINKYIENDTKSSPLSVFGPSHQIGEIKAYLDRLPAEFYDNYEQWVKVGAALHAEFDETDDEHEAIALYDEFSKKSSRYEKGAAFKKWKGFDKSECQTSLGALFYHCQKPSAEENVALFSKFIADEKVNFKTLKAKLAEIKLEDYEIDMFISLIADALTRGIGQKFNDVSTRRLVKKLRAEIAKENEEELDRQAIGLDDTLATMVLKESYNDGHHLLNLNNNLFCYKNGCWIKQEEAMLQKTVLEAIKKIMSSTNEDHARIRAVIYKKKKHDDIDGLTNKITSLILKMRATPESDDILNLRNKAEHNFSVVNTLNKELYFENGKLTVEDHKYDSYLISQFNVNYIPGEDCPNWKMMLNRIFQLYPDKEDMIRHFCELLGYILQSKKRDPAFMILLGSGRNGKSFIMKEFSMLMGVDSTVNDDMLKFSQGAHAESALVGKNMFIDDDWKKGQLLPDDYIKKLSENKTLTANPKFQHQFNFVSKCTPVILSNNSPKSKDTSWGIQRRAHVFNFNYQIQDSEIDFRLDEKLKAERSGFLNLLIESYLNYERRGSFKIPYSCQKSINEWMKGSNPLMAFMHDKTIITEDHSDSVRGQRLFDLYISYTQHENMSHNMTRSNFYDELKGMKGLQVRMNSTEKSYYIHGLKIKDGF